MGNSDVMILVICILKIDEALFYLALLESNGINRKTGLNAI